MITLICGLLRFDRARSSPELVEQMASAMSAGAPATAVSAIDGPVALCSVSKAPCERPPRPRIERVAHGLLAADARLYDGDLDRALARNRPEDLHGDFALAFWKDSKLHLWRDPNGVRPLQYVHRPGKYFAFASLPSALLDPGLATRDLDPDVLRLFQATLCAIAPRTYFRDISSLQAGHSISVDMSGQISKRRYWKWRSLSLLPARTPRREISAELRRLTEVAVRRRCPATGPGAGHFSGGLDSTSVSLLGARAVGPTRPWYGYAFVEEKPAPDFLFIDERSAVEASTAHAQNLTLVPITTEGRHRWLFDLLDPDIWLPCGMSVPEERALTHAACNGVSVIFSGWGGDQAATWRGGGGLAELFWRGAWGSLLRTVRERSRRTGDHPLRILRSAVLVESLPPWLRHHLRGTGRTLPDTFAPKGAIRLNEIPHRAEYTDTQARRVGWLEHWWLPAHLEQFAQRGARHGISYAFPLLDRDLVEFALTIPGSAMVEEGLNRMPYRRAMEGVLPDPVRLRAEKLAPWPLESWRVARDRDWLSLKFEELAKSDRLRHYIDTGRLAAEIREWPQEAALAELIAADAKQGRQRDPGNGALCNALALAHIITVSEQGRPDA